MASTGAVLRIRPRLPASLSANRKTAAQFELNVRLLSGIYSATNIPAGSDTRNALAWLPSNRVPLTDGDKCMTVEWYRFFHYLCTNILGGPTASTVPDIADAVVASSTTAAATTQSTAALAQQADANAQALAAAVQVVQTAALSGAVQIPPVQLTNGQYQR